MLGPEIPAGVVAAGGRVIPEIRRVSGSLNLPHRRGEQGGFDAQTKYPARQYHLLYGVIAQQSQSNQSVGGKTVFRAGGQ